MRCQIEGGDGRVVEVTEGAVMAVATTNPVVAAVLRRPVMDER
jgi:hypothetical protein